MSGVVTGGLGAAAGAAVGAVVGGAIMVAAILVFNHYKVQFKSYYLQVCVAVHL